MKKGQTIREFMLSEHGIILALLSDFSKNFKSDKAESYFKKLKTKQENHVSAEEKAIFILYDEGKKFPEIVVILKQHEELEALVNKIKEKLDKGLDHYEETVKDLQGLMKEHIKLENEKFYPKLDSELTDKQQHTILKTLQDVILG